MTRRDFLFKWTLYGVALLLVWLFELFFLARWPLFGVKAMLLPTAAVVVAVLEGSGGGGGFALAVGVLCSAAYGGFPGAFVLGMVVISVAVGVAAQYVVRQNFVGCLLCTIAALAVIDLFRVLAGLATGASIAALARVAGLEILLSLVWVGPVYLHFRWVYRRTQFSTLF